MRPHRDNIKVHCEKRVALYVSQMGKLYVVRQPHGAPVWGHTISMRCVVSIKNNFSNSSRLQLRDGVLSYMFYSYSIELTLGYENMVKGLQTALHGAT